MLGKELWKISPPRLIRYLLYIPMALVVYGGYAQPPVPLDSLSREVVIDNIFVTGNRRTKEHIILREIHIKQGEQYNIEDLREILDLDRDKIYNTSLFNTVDVGIYDVSYEKVTVHVDVSERWYLYPIPKIDFVDRNFNDWIQNHDADLSRLLYGMKFTQYNFRGRNERLSLITQVGYTDLVEVEYEVPYINRNQRTGLSLIFNYGENTNVNYTTLDHRQQFVDSDRIIRRGYFSQVMVTRRNSFFNRHFVQLDYSNQWVGDTVTFLNPGFFSQDGASRQRFFRVNYTFSSDHRDIVAYPLRGYNVIINLSKTGLGVYDDINLLSVRASFAKYWDLGKKYYTSNYSSWYLSFPDEQPYFNTKGMGFGKDLIRGYELIVIQGRSYFLNKTTFKKELFSFTKKINAIPLEQFQTFPFAAYLKTYFDFGYVNNTTNNPENVRLTNDVIWGTGVGIDFFTTYDLVMRFEYSLNSELETGLFFHFRKEF